MNRFPLNLKEQDNGFIVTVKVVPGSSKTALAGFYDGMLKIKVAAAPEKGKANQCLIDFLARFFDIKKQQIGLISGQTSPIKQILIEGYSIQQAAMRLQNEKEQ